MVVADEAVHAYALPGWTGWIVVTAGMLGVLDEPGQDALLAHEQAHLAGFHYLFTTAARLAAAASPLLPGARAVEYTVQRWADERSAAVVGDRRLVAHAIGRAALPTGRAGLAACGRTPAPARCPPGRGPARPRRRDAGWHCAPPGPAWSRWPGRAPWWRPTTCRTCCPWLMPGTSADPPASSGGTSAARTSPAGQPGPASPPTAGRSVRPLYAAGFTTALGAHAVAANLGVYTGTRHGPLLTLGILLALNDGAEVILKPVFGALADRIGGKPVLIGGAARIRRGERRVPPRRQPRRAVRRPARAGRRRPGVLPAASTLVARLAPGGQGRVFGSYGAWKGLSDTLGPLLGSALGAPHGYGLLFAVLAALDVVVAGSAMLAVPGLAAAAQGSVRPSRAWLFFAIFGRLNGLQQLAVVLGVRPESGSSSGRQEPGGPDAGEVGVIFGERHLASPRRSTPEPGQVIQPALAVGPARPGLRNPGAGGWGCTGSA